MHEFDADDRRSGWTEVLETEHWIKPGSIER
jgi:hypothetical protein